MSNFTWFPSTSEITPGGSAILGSNRLTFFLIHHTALCTITVSFVASLIVFSQVVKKWKKSTKAIDLSIRFPFYLAVAEALWGISHFSDHMYLVTTQTYTINTSVKLGLSINLWFFFGYQQMMHCSVAAYTYLKVVHRKSLELGKWEWKLHLLWAAFLTGTILLFYFVGCFGNSGYWMMYDATTITGKLLGIAMAITSTLNACCTTLGYYMIRRKVQKMKQQLAVHKVSTDSVASQCLATYVWMAACLYCPLALLLWVNILAQLAFEVVDPISSWLLVLVANSSGWANAVAYFHNEDIKRKRLEGYAGKYAAQSSQGTMSTEDNVVKG